MMRFAVQLLCLSGLLMATAFAQNPLGGLQVGEGVPSEVEGMYRAGLQYLASTQSSNGSWADGYGQQPGVVGIAALAFVASGEDPNHGPYRHQIRRAAEFILSQQDRNTGYIGNSMYNHAFATLALAELYGHLHDPPLGPALKRAVDLILASQAQNPLGAWRYSPTSKDADTTVSGGQMVALFAAKNAGLEIPQEAFVKGLRFFRETMDPQGGIGYTNSSGGNSTRSAIASLSFSLAGDRNSEEPRKINTYLRNNRDAGSSYLYYHFYYMAQALFQTDMREWAAWNAQIVRLFQATQETDGSWNGQHGPSFSTASALLTLALNYRLKPIYER
jgi:hypothetical protein